MMSGSVLSRRSVSGNLTGETSGSINLSGGSFSGDCLVDAAELSKPVRRKILHVLDREGKK